MKQFRIRRGYNINEIYIYNLEIYYSREMNRW